MKRKILAAMLALAVTLSFTGCAVMKKQQAQEATTAGTEAMTEAATEAATKAATGTTTAATEAATEADGGDYAFSDDTIKLANYKGIDVRVYSSSTNRSVQDSVNAMLDAFSTYDEVKDREITETDTVKINVTATVDGTEYTPLCFTNFSNSMEFDAILGGFNAKLIGQKPGTKVKFKIEVPQDSSNTDLAGKTVEFTVELLYLYGEKHTPEYNDAFVKENLGYDSVADYEKSIKEDNDRMQATMERDDTENQIKMYLTSNSTVEKIDDSILAKYKEEYLSAYKNGAISSGVEFEDYVTNSMGMTMEQLNENVDYVAKSDASWEMIVRKIAELEGIEYSDEAWEGYLDSLAKESGCSSVDEYKKNFLETDAAKAKSQFEYLESTVMDKLIEYANVEKETEGLANE